MTKPTKWVCAQRRLRSAWASLSAWRNLGSLAAHWVHIEDSIQPGRMPRLIWVFARRTLILLVLSCRGSDDVLPGKQRRTTSSEWPQSFSPTGLCAQSRMEASLPWQLTSSSQIWSPTLTPRSPSWPLSTRPPLETDSRHIAEMDVKWKLGFDFTVTKKSISIMSRLMTKPTK